MLQHVGVLYSQPLIRPPFQDLIQGVEGILETWKCS
jgi:hypothetical protein